MPRTAASSSAGGGVAKVIAVLLAPHGRPVARPHLLGTCLQASGLRSRRRWWRSFGETKGLLCHRWSGAGQTQSKGGVPWAWRRLWATPAGPHAPCT